MSDKIVEKLNNYDSATIGGLFHSLANLKITTIIALITIIFSFLSGTFMLGKFSGQKKIAIEINRPFDIKIGNTLELKDIILVPNTTLVEPDDSSKVYTLKEITDEFDDKPVGEVVVKKDPNEKNHNSIIWMFKK